MDAARPAGLLEVGRVIKAHGLSGEVVVELSTNRLERVAVGARLHTSGSRVLEVVASRPHQGRFLVRFVGVTDRNEADALHSMKLWAEPIEDETAMFVHDLIGKVVLDRLGARLGVVTAVEANPASDLLVIDGAHLVPMRFVLEANAEHIVVEVPEGLFS